MAWQPDPQTATTSVKVNPNTASSLLMIGLQAEIAALKTAVISLTDRTAVLEKELWGATVSANTMCWGLEGSAPELWGTTVPCWGGSVPEPVPEPVPAVDTAPWGGVHTPWGGVHTPWGVPDKAPAAVQAPPAMDHLARCASAPAVFQRIVDKCVTAGIYDWAERYSLVESKARWGYDLIDYSAPKERVDFKNALEAFTSS
jgi:hypothetical protein